MTDKIKTIEVLITKLPHLNDLPLPAYATLHSAGMDLYAAIDEDMILKPQERQLVPTGISIALPEGYEAQIRSRSGLAYKHGVVVLNSPGTIDADYRGEIKIIISNLSNEQYTIKRGDRIAQMIIAKYSVVNWNIVDELPETTRNHGGFGSSGK